MEWIAAKILLRGENTQLAIDLISDVFYGLGVKGVEIEDPDLVPAEGWGEDAVPLPRQHAVIGYFADTTQTTYKLRMLEEKIRKLEKTHDFQYTSQFQRMDEADWAESWKAYFWPQRITPSMTVKPTWRDYTAEADEIVLEIDPGMAFGTGTHPTTALCIRLMEKYLSEGSWFLDVGTGSGILMIAAAKLGAEKLVGIDNDELAIEIATKNLRLNHINRKQVELRVGHLTDDITGRFDLIVANILSETIIRLLETIEQKMTRGGILICSGIYEDNCNDVIKQMRRQGLNILEAPRADNWVAIACTNADLTAGV
jgi:ribosomal protein L11 methyltransferase